MANESNIRLLNTLRTAESLLPKNSILKSLYDRHSEKDPETLALDIRRDGSNTLKWPITGPVDYDEVVRDVAEKKGLSKKIIKKCKDEIDIENILLLHDLSKHAMDSNKKIAFMSFVQEKTGKSLNGMRQEDIMNLLLELPSDDISKLLRSIFIAGSGTKGAYAGTILSHIFRHIHPLLVVGSLALGVLALSGPAYRKTVPTVYEIALLRKAIYEHYLAMGV